MPNQVIELYIHNRWESKVAGFDIIGYQDCIDFLYQFFTSDAPKVYLTYETQAETYGAIMFDLEHGQTVEGGVQPLDDYIYIGYTYGNSVMDVYDNYFKNSKTYEENLVHFIFKADRFNTYLSRNAFMVANWKAKKEDSEYTNIDLYIADTDFTRKHIEDGNPLGELLWPNHKVGYCIFTFGDGYLYDTFNNKQHAAKAVRKIATVPLPTLQWKEPTAKWFAKYCSDNYPSSLSQTRKRFNNWLINLFLTNKSTYHGKIEMLIPLTSTDSLSGIESNQTNEERVETSGIHDYGLGDRSRRFEVGVGEIVLERDTSSSRDRRS